MHKLICEWRLGKYNVCGFTDTVSKRVIMNVRNNNMYYHQHFYESIIMNIYDNNISSAQLNIILIQHHSAV